MKPEAPNWLIPFAEATCPVTGHSCFAVIRRLESFQFSRHTSVAPEFTCIVPEYPDLSVTIPCNSVPANEDFCVTIKVYNLCIKAHCGLGPKYYSCSLITTELFWVGPLVDCQGHKAVEFIGPD